MADARATIHIVCAEHDACELLREIVVLVRRARGAEHAHAVSAVLRDDASKIVGGETNRVLPSHVFPFAVFSNHRLRDTIRRVHEIKGVPPFDTEMTFAYRRIERGLYLHNAVAVRADQHLAADTAIRTRGARPFLRDAEFENAFIFKRAAWAGIDARATGHARALAQRCARIRNNPCRVAAIPNLPDKLAL